MSIISDLTSLYFSNHQITPKINQNIESIFLILWVNSFWSQNSTKFKSVQAWVYIIGFCQYLIYFPTSISNSQVIKDIKIKSMNKNGQRKYYYFIFFHILKNQAIAQIYIQ